MMTDDRNPPLPEYAADLASELRRRMAGEVRFGSADRALYAYDASVFRQVPVGVVLPRDAADVEAALDVCRRFGAPVLARGCGTGLAGQTVNAAARTNSSTAPKTSTQNEHGGGFCKTIKARGGTL